METQPFEAKDLGKVEFKNKTEIRQAFFGAVDIMKFGFDDMDPVEKAKRIDLGNKASKQIFRQPDQSEFKPEDVFVLNQEAGKKIVTRLGSQEYVKQMFAYKEMFAIALGEVKEDNKTRKERIMRDGNTASVELFGKNTKCIVFA